MNANQSLLDSLCRIRELLCIAGSQGEVYTKVLGQAAVQPPVGLFLAKKYLASEGFTFRHQGTGNIMDIKTLTLPKLTGDVLCFCPAALCSAAFHCDSHDDVIEETNPARLILKYIADAGEHGMTSVELSKINGVRNVHSWVDKLVQCGTVVKRSVMPVPNAPVKQRANASCMLLHLTQYAMPYQPDADGLQILPGDDIRDDIYRYLVELLDRHQLRYIPTIDLASYLNINKRHMQYLRNQALMLGRQNDCILHFSEEWCCPLKFNFEPGVRRLAWCMSKSLPSSTKDNDIPKRAWNFPLYEQIDYFLRRKGYLTSAEIRKLTALSRKRAPKVMDLFQQSGYESIKIQDGKQIINKLLPKPGSEFGEVKEYDMEDVVHGCETFEMPVDSLVRQSSAESSSADVLHVEVPTSSSNKRKSIEMTPNSASKKSKGSIDQQERRNIVIEYLQEQPTKVGSLLEVSQKIRTYFRDQDRKFYTDKKTITRCLKGLQDDGLIDIEETNLDESQSENFGGNIKKVELIILKTKDNETKEERNHRIEEYVNSYVHIKTVYKRREMIELKDEGEEDEEDEHSVHELPADVVMDAEEPLEEFQFTTNAAVLEIVEEKPVIKRNRRKSKIVVEEQDATVTPAAAEVAVVPEEQQAGEDFSDMIVMLPRKSNSVDRRKSSGDDTWTVEEDLLLLDNFIQNLLVRSARVGLPDLLKPHINMKKTTGMRYFFVIGPKRAIFESTLINADIDSLRSYYVTTGVNKLPTHTASSAKRRISNLVREYKTIKQLIVRWFWQKRNCASESMISSINDSLQSPQLLIEESTSMINLVSEIFKLLGGVDGAKYFRLSDISFDMETDYKMVIKILRELYMHGVIRSAGTTDIADQQSFHFTSSFENLGYEKDFGGFFSELFEKPSNESGANDLKKILSLLHQMVEGKNDSVLAKFLLSGEDEDTPVQTIGTKAALESVETDDTKVQITPLESSNMFPKKSTERIEECITFPITTSTHFETARDFFEKGVGLINPELLPWIGKDNVFHYNTFKALVLQIVTFLAQNPCANLAKIHNMLVVIPKPVVECMLQNLVKSSLLIERKAISSVALKSPFQSKQLWNKQLTASLISTYSICI